MHPDFPGQVTHLEYRYYQEHVNNILYNPRHEAHYMGIDTDLYDDKELIWECFHRLVYLPQPIEQKIPFKAEVIDTTYEEEEIYDAPPIVQNSPT